MAKQWEDKGAQWLHVVDLDGAKTGEIQNFTAIKNIIDAVSIPIQVGGGIRTLNDIAKLFGIGVKRFILGTRAIEDPTFRKNMKSLVAAHDIAVSLDCHNGMIARRGWVETSDLKATDFIKELEQCGVKTVIYTDIARDGMLTGPNWQALEEILAVTKIQIIASGGVATLDDIRRLKTLESRGVIGAITGKAIYEGRFTLEDALKLC